LTLVLVESALQIVPPEIQSHAQIKRYADRREKKPDEVLLDRAFHHAAMQKLARKGYRVPVEKMGRPDIVHNVLLQIIETPLNWEEGLRVFVHTQDDYVISINPKIRLPKNYVRFVGLIEQLFAQKRVPEKGEPLMQLEKSTLQQLVRNTHASNVLGFSILGKPTLMRVAAEHASKLENPIVFIGGFPRGHFGSGTRSLLNDICSVDRVSLDAWVVAGRFVYDFEWSIGVTQNRIKTKTDRT
jgi:rRNA small subunit pseudouridine methyltransferase Nep1